MKTILCDFCQFSAKKLAYWQVDQIGRIFACWAIVYLGTFFENYKSSQKFWSSFISSKNNVISLTKSWLGYISVDFFTISSGRPDWQLLCIFTKQNSTQYHGVDVMNTIFCYFCQFSAKKLAFSSKPNVTIKILHYLALFWVKKGNFLAFFGENILKDHNIGPWRDSITRRVKHDPLDHLCCRKWNYHLCIPRRQSITGFWKCSKMLDNT
jgi:hypothetical protein